MLQRLSPGTAATRLRSFLRDNPLRLRTPQDWIVASVVIGLLAYGCVSAAWIARYSYAIHRLTRGVGDTVFYSADGRPWFRMDEQRHDVALADIAPQLQAAVIAVEDHRFYRHPGVDPIALGRAIVRDLQSDSRLEGGSTLTQQLARTLFLSNAKTYGRKIKEAALALLLEQQLSKSQILELYLNRVYISAGVYGVETMSEKLYGKRAANLSLAESALIAGLIRAPSALSPWTNLDAAVRRSHTVLTRMREEGFIAPPAEAAARAAAVRIRPFPAATEARAGYAKDFLRQAFRDEFGGDHPPDWQVHTTFVPELQDAAEQAVAIGLARLRKPDLQAALVALEPSTGNIVAIVGGRDYRTTTFNRAARSRRQPGSAFKPFVFAAALERGFSPVSVLSRLSELPPAGPDEWTPRNAHDDMTEDAMTLRAALLESNNRAAVALQRQIGTRPVLHLADDVGLRDLPDVPSLALGTGLVTPLDLTAAFAAFPNHGTAVRPRALTLVLDDQGGEVLRTDVREQRVLPETIAFQMVSMLADVVDRGTGASARSLGVKFPVGGKTGTTDGFRDGWFVGFSSSLVAGVWVGFDQPQTIGADAYGARVALPIWSEFMRRAARRYPARPFEAPAGMREEELCKESYLKPVEECPTYVEYFKEGDAIPSRLCPIHRGTFKQRAQRAIEGFFSGLGKRLKGVFGR
jgi:1A family penicillin-binding protein